MLHVNISVLGNSRMQLSLWLAIAINVSLFLVHTSQSLCSANSVRLHSLECLNFVYRLWCVTRLISVASVYKRMNKCSTFKRYHFGLANISLSQAFGSVYPNILTLRDRSWGRRKKKGLWKAVCADAQIIKKISLKLNRNLNLLTVTNLFFIRNDNLK